MSPDRDFPTAPVNKTPIKQIYDANSSLRMPIIPMNVNIDSSNDEMTDPPSYSKSHVPELQDKKNNVLKLIDTCNKEPTDSECNEYNSHNFSFDMSIDVGRNDEDSASNNDKETKDTLEQLDINKMFSNQTTELNRSPLKTETVSPVKRAIDDEIDTHKKEGASNKKLKLDMVPNLQQGIHNNNNNNNNTNMAPEQNIKGIGSTSPIPIEMIDNKIMTSPSRSTIKIDINDENEQENNGMNGNPVDHNNGNDNTEMLNESHKLTPIQHQLSMDYDMSNASVTDIDSVGKRNEELNQQLYSTNQKMNEILVIHDKKKIEVKQLIFEMNLLKEEKDRLENIVNDENRETEEIKNKNEALRTRLKEVKSEISMLTSNQTLLQEKYDKVYNENEKLQNAKEMLQKEIETLQKSLEDSANILEDLTAHNKDLETKYNEIDESKKTVENEKNELAKDLKRINSRMEGKDNTIHNLENKVKDLIDSERNHSKNLIDQVATLTNEKMSIEEKYKKLENEFTSETQYLQDTIKEKEQTIKEKEQAINEQEIKLKDIEGEKQNLEAQISERTEVIETLKKTYEEANDNATVRTAEVTELNDKIVNLNESNERLEEAANKMSEEIQEWKLKYDEEVEKQKNLIIEIESQKSENNEVGELKHQIDLLKNSQKESLGNNDKLLKENDELKNRLNELQHGFTNTNSNEKIDDKKLLPENEDSVTMLKNQIMEYKRKLEQRDSDTTKRLRKLSEDLYVQYSSKHEQKVKLLKQNYEKKFHNEIEKLEMDKKGLVQEIEQLNNKLSLERKEKQELLKVLDKN